MRGRCVYHGTFVLDLLRVELLQRLHRAEVEIVTLLIEILQFPRRLVFNYTFPLLRGPAIQVRLIAIIGHQSA